jgi:hypothetical protein
MTTKPVDRFTSFRPIALIGFLLLAFAAAAAQSVNIDRVVVELEPEIQRTLLAGNIPSASIALIAGDKIDEKGYFVIGDLPPGEHIVLLDEKTIPEQAKSVAGSQSIKVSAGNQTDTVFPVVLLPDQIKKFPRN